jgi:hypothetical protein
MKTKVCKICKVSKGYSQFHKMVGCIGNVRNTCKSCRKLEKEEYSKQPHIKLKQQQYYQVHKEEFRKRMSKHYHSLNGQYHQYKKRAKKGGVEFTLSQEECIPFFNTTCTYCGGSIKGLGIDRLDNKKGYICNNITPCCSTCNFMKHTLNKEEFYTQIYKIVHFKQQENVLKYRPNKTAESN